MTVSVDPNDFVDCTAAFDDDHDPEDGITYAEFTVVRGRGHAHTSLVYWANGVYFLGGKTNTNWGLNMYEGYHYNGQTVPIGARAARHILETISDHSPLEECDWAEHDWTYFE